MCCFIGMGVSKKDVPIFGGGRGLAAMRTKVDKGKEGFSCRWASFFRAVSVREKRACKSDFVIIFMS